MCNLICIAVKLKDSMRLISAIMYAFLHMVKREVVRVIR